MIDKSRCVSTIYLEAPIETIWWYIATPKGWNSYLSDIAVASDSSKEFVEGEDIEMVIGELTNHATCISLKKPYLLALQDRFTALFPDGDRWDYELQTTFKLEPVEHMVKVSVEVEDFSDDEMLQWVREGTETGWRQSLFNLKCILELGLDLRYQIFGYPRLGVFNYTLTEQQRNELGLKGSGGNYLKEVFPNSPAALAGMQNGDVITHMDGKEVTTYHELVKALSRRYGKKEPVSVAYWRNGQSWSTEVELTLDDQYTGLIDPNEVDLEAVAEERRMRSGKIRGLE